MINSCSIFLLLLYFAWARITSFLRVPLAATLPLYVGATIWVFGTLSFSQIIHVITRRDFIGPWSPVVLFLSVGYLMSAIGSTGILQQACTLRFARNRTHDRPRILYYLLVCVPAVSIVLGPNVTIVSSILALLRVLDSYGPVPLPWLSASFLVTNLSSMVLFATSLTNLILLEALRISCTAFTAYTIAPFLGCAMSSIALLHLLSFWYRYPRPAIPSPQTATPVHEISQPFLSLKVDYKRVPVQVWRCGLCLGCIFIGSLFGISPWIVALICAAPSLVYDAAYDYYKYRTTRPGLYHLLQGQPTHFRASWYTLDASSDTDEDSSDENDVVVVLTNQMERLSVDEGQRIISPSHKCGTSAFANLEYRNTIRYTRAWAHPPTFSTRFPTLALFLGRFPLTFIPMFISYLILFEGLIQTGWIDFFCELFLRVTEGGKMHFTIWMAGLICIALANLTGSKIGAVVLLSGILREAPISEAVLRAAAVSVIFASSLISDDIRFTANYAEAIMDRRVQTLLKNAQSSLSYRLLFVAIFVVGLTIVSAEMTVFTLCPISSNFSLTYA